MVLFVGERAVNTMSGARVVRRVRRAAQLAGQLVLLVTLFLAGDTLVWATAVPLPGNLVGMLILLALLHVGVLRLEHVQDLADFGLKHLNLFFVPLAVGLMTWTDLLATSGVALAVSLIGSAVVGLAITGLISQRLATRGGESDAE